MFISENAWAWIIVLGCLACLLCLVIAFQRFCLSLLGDDDGGSEQLPTGAGPNPWDMGPAEEIADDRHKCRACGHPFKSVEKA